MQIVRFMPPGQPLTVGNPGALTASRQAVLDRYAAIIKHIDVLATALPRAFQKGLETLRQFAGDPSAQVEPFGGAAEDVIQFTLVGTFIPGEEIWINAVSARGTRVGPPKLAPPAGFALPENQFQTQDDLLAGLRLLRVAPTGFSGALALPPTLDRTQIVGFEVTRSFRQIDYTLASASVQNLQQINGLLGGLAASWLGDFLTAQGPALSVPPVTVHLNPSQLERELGGPMVFQFFRQHRGVRRLGQSSPVGQGGDLRQRQPVWRHPAADPLSGPGPAAGADAALQRNPDHRNDGPACCPQHHPLLQGDMGLADRRGTGDPAGPIHHRRAAQRNRRCFADDPAARLRAEQGAGILRQFDDPSVLDPAIGDRRHQPAAAGGGRRRAGAGAGVRSGADQAVAFGLSAAELRFAPVDHRPADARRPGRSGARPLPIGREARPDEVLELAGQPVGHRADDLAGHPADDDALDRRHVDRAQYARPAAQPDQQCAHRAQPRHQPPQGHGSGCRQPEGLRHRAHRPDPARLVDHQRPERLQFGQGRCAQGGDRPAIPGHGDGGQHRRRHLWRQSHRRFERRLGGQGRRLGGRWRRPEARASPGEGQVGQGQLRHRR